MDRDQPGSGRSTASIEASSAEGDEQLLSVGEAALRYGLTARKVNQLAYLNQLDGARKVRGRRGQEWRVPAAALEAHGFQRQDEPEETTQPDVVKLQSSVRLLTDMLVRERQLGSDRQRELEAARLEIGTLRNQLQCEQLRRQQIERELEQSHWHREHN